MAMQTTGTEYAEMVLEPSKLTGDLSISCQINPVNTQYNSLICLTNPTVTTSQHKLERKSTQIGHNIWTLDQVTAQNRAGVPNGSWIQVGNGLDASNENGRLAPVVAGVQNTFGGYNPSIPTNLTKLLVSAFENSGGVSEHWTGEVSDIAVWDRILTAAEWLALSDFSSWPNDPDIIDGGIPMNQGLVVYQPLYNGFDDLGFEGASMSGVNSPTFTASPPGSHVPSAGGPNPPTQFTAAPASSSQINLTWTDAIP